ncbi:MAG TPA: 4-alpha-glucanotransferase [Paracoccaceae bacterium]|nr:4-alpha-glucanotransferase [Paracoccaceae bacterium]
MTPLARLCASHGIEPRYHGIDGAEQEVPEDTLRTLAEVFDLTAEAETAPAGIAEARAEIAPPRCFVPPVLQDARAWGITAQVASLVSDRNLGMGDFADLASLAQIAAAEGADFLGVNPLHAMFWSDPERISPFSPSNRRFLDPRYLAPDWIDGFDGLTPEEADHAARLRGTPRVQTPAAAVLKDRVLRRLFARAGPDPEFDAFVRKGGEALRAHALFETVSAAMVRDGHAAGWMGWPEPYQDCRSDEVHRLADQHPDDRRYHLWLQWQTDRQLARVQRTARESGMRIGLYLDIAVGAQSDGSASWTDPHLTVPELKIGAPPDPFSARGQDWGLAPLSPVVMRERRGEPLAEIMAAVMRHAGAVRIDHAMSLARLWLIPQGRAAVEGAYMRYPLSILLARLAETSQAARTMVIGEDLGVVPHGFRTLMADRALHSYKVWFFERGPDGLPDIAAWPADGLACLGTHDLHTTPGWIAGADIDLATDLGRIDPDDAGRALESRHDDRARLARLLGAEETGLSLSLALHRHMAASPCRLAALQIEDALGVEAQVNVPGTIDEYPNWRTRLPVPLDGLSDDHGFRAHTQAMRDARPR